MAASLSDSRAVPVSVNALRIGGGASSVLEPVLSCLASLASIVDVSSSVHAGPGGVVDGVVEALDLGVALVSSSGSKMHDLVEHGHSLLVLLVLGTEGELAESDVSVGVLTSIITSPSSGHESEDSSVSTGGACARAGFTAHHRPVSSVSKHHVHGGLESQFDVLVLMGIALAKPLLE